MTSIAEPIAPARGPSRVRAVLLALLLTLLALSFSPAAGLLWVAVPAATAVSLLAAWRFGPAALLLPVALAAGALLLGPPDAVSAWWIPAAALSGVWMGLREEGGGPSSGERAWMLLPLFVLAAALPWTGGYGETVKRVDRDFAKSDSLMLDMARSRKDAAQWVGAIEDAAQARPGALPNLIPTALFAWMTLLVGAGRAFSARAAHALRWPPLSRSRLRDWRMPDGAIWLFLAGFGLLLGGWSAWAPTAWTLLLNTGLAFCVQGIAVVESLLVARGVSSPIIVVSMMFAFLLAWPVALVTAAALGLSDVWLDFRRLEPAAEPRD